MALTYTDFVFQSMSLATNIGACVTRKRKTLVRQKQEEPGGATLLVAARVAEPQRPHAPAHGMRFAMTPGGAMALLCGSRSHIRSKK